MKVELEVRWDGHANGLAEHRLSIATFGEPLRLLLRTLQTTASAILAKAEGDPTYGGHRLRSRATLIDFELRSVADGCVRLELECTMRGPQPDMFEDLHKRALESMLEDIVGESRGTPCSKTAREFLSSMPAEVTAQEYTPIIDGARGTSVSIGKVQLPGDLAPLPGVLKVVGNVIGIGFPPGAPQVRLQTTEGHTFKSAASPEDIDLAWSLRDKAIEAMVAVRGTERRLVWLREFDSERPAPERAAVAAAVQKRWADLLARLAQ